MTTTAHAPSHLRAEARRPSRFTARLFSAALLFAGSAVTGCGAATNGPYAGNFAPSLADCKATCTKWNNGHFKVCIDHNTGFAPCQLDKLNRQVTCDAIAPQSCDQQLIVMFETETP